MKWTTEHPTKAGFYWYRDDNRAVVLEVRDRLVKEKMLAWDCRMDGSARFGWRNIV